MSDFVAAERIIDEYVQDYVFEGDEGHHTPTESECALIKDAIMGLLADPEFLAALSAAPRPTYERMSEEDFERIEREHARFCDYGRPHSLKRAVESEVLRRLGITP